MANALSLIDGEYPRRISSPGTSLVPTNDVGRTGYKPNFTMGGPPAGAGSPDPFGEEAVRRAREAAASRRAAPPPAAPTSAPAPVSTPRPTLRQGLASANPTVLGKASYLGGRAGAAVAKTARALGPAAVGADVVSHFNDYKINDPEVDSSARGTWNALKDEGPRALFDADSLTRRSLGKGMLETGMDLGSFAADTLDYVVPGKAPVSTAYDRMLRNQFGDQLVGGAGTPSAEPAPSLAYQPNPTDQRLASNTQRSPLSNPTTLPDREAASSREVVPGVYNHGRGQYSDNPNGMGMPEGFTGRPSAQNDAILQRMSDQSQAESMARVSAGSAAKQYNAEVQRAQAINADEHARHNTPAARMQRLADPFSAEGRAMRTLQMDIDSSLDRRGRPTGRTQALVDQYKAATGAYLEEPGQQRIAETERYKSDNALRGNMYQADSSRASYAYTADQKLRGDTIGAEASMRSNRAKLQYDREKDQRDYNLNVGKYNIEKSANALKQREASEKSLREQILGQLPMVRDKDGKMVPDEQGAAQYVRAAHARLGERETALRQELQRNPGNTQAAGELESLRHYGVAALSADPAANNQFMTGMQARSDARSDAGWMPWSADRGAGATSKPITSLKWDNGSLLDGYRDQDGNWIPEHVIDQGGSLFGARTGKYDSLKVK